MLGQTVDSERFAPDASLEVKLLARLVGDRLMTLAGEAPVLRAEVKRCLVDPHLDQTRLAAMERRGHRLINDVSRLSRICRQLTSPTHQVAHERPKLA
jgi:hypothetical protein